jgi:hypothetical protein
MLMLFRWLPTILADVIELADPLKLRLFNLFGQIVEIVSAPSLTKYACAIFTGYCSRTPWIVSNLLSSETIAV